MTELERGVIEAARAWRRHPPRDWTSSQTEIDLVNRIDALETALAPPSLEEQVKAVLSDYDTHIASESPGPSHKPYVDRILALIEGRKP